MTVAELKEKLCLKTAFQPMVNMNREITGCYASDYLSNAMKNAKPGNILLTVVSNSNIVAVAMLRNISCIVICENTKPDKETIAQAIKRNIPILISNRSVYNMAVEISKVI